MTRLNRDRQVMSIDEAFIDPYILGSWQPRRYTPILSTVTCVDRLSPRFVVVRMLLDCDDPEVRWLVATYIARLDLPAKDLAITCHRDVYRDWLGRRVDASLGGAYTYLRRTRQHAILINRERIDRVQPNALEIVVAEELLHMRDFLDGDHRRHAKHGYDRIAYRVAALTDATLTEVRNCLLPVKRRPLRYRYVCPACGFTIWRRVRGTWSCRRCAPVFQRCYQLVLQCDAHSGHEAPAAKLRD